MNNDPFYLQIIERLGKKLDPDVFEQCMGDLLRDTYPGLVPVPGGKDAGMDGAIGDGKGEPMPLICTTQDSVITNLTKSLTSHSKTNRHRNLAVLATSRKLTPQRRKNLSDRAAELGFTLVNIHDQEDVANRLYHNPKWCRELLNLTGRPPALSFFPKSDRLILNQKLIGREEDFNWLKITKGDRLLVGQPGSGKSFLLHLFAKDGNGLFVVDKDREAIANGIRSQQPSALIVDDAQIYLDLLSDLKQIRSELGADLSIIVSCWVGDFEIVKNAMNLTEIQTHELDLLPQSKIVDVIHDVGLGGPERLIREIIEQAGGRPGLAATLAYLSLQGGVKEVMLGEIISNSIQKVFEPKFGKRIVDIMAAFSIGGEFGMKLSDVSVVCQLPIIDLHAIVTELGTGGVLWEKFNEFLSIHPSTLRHALIRDVFFADKIPLDIRPFINYSPNREETVRTLIGARYRGASIPDAYLIELLEQAQSSAAWKEYASLGPREATWVLNNHPEYAGIIAYPALIYIPKLAIKALFTQSIGDRRELHSAIDHPLRIIEDWIKQAKPGSREVLERRNLLITATVEWLDQKNDVEVGCQAIQIAYKPIYQNLTTRPGNEDVITIHEAYILPDEMAEIHGRWPEIVNSIKTLQKVFWKPIKEIIHTWAYPELHGIALPITTRELMLSFSERALNDILSIDPKCQGLLHWGKQIAIDAKLNVKINLDRDFETLYPIEERRNWRTQGKTSIERVKNLAFSWSKHNPSELIQKIRQIEQDASSHDIHWPRHTPYLCHELSAMVNDPLLWGNIIIDNSLSGELVLPFFKKAADNKIDGWVEGIYKCLGQQEYVPVAIEIALTINETPDSLLNDVLQLSSGFGSMIEILCMRQEVPTHVLKQLLLYKDPKVASEAAKGEWFAKNAKSIRTGLDDAWQIAAIQSNDEHFLASILENNGDLAYKWLLRIFNVEHDFIFRFDHPMVIAAKALSADQKFQILEKVPAEDSFSILIEKMIGDDLAVFKTLLKSKRLAEYHLVPLNWHEGESWIEKAKIALEMGYSEQQIVDAAYYGYSGLIVSWAGDESIIRKEWVKRFEKLCEYDDEQIREIGNIGKDLAEKKLRIALEREKNIKIYGYGI